MNNIAKHSEELSHVNAIEDESYNFTLLVKSESEFIKNFLNEYFGSQKAFSEETINGIVKSAISQVKAKLGNNSLDSNRKWIRNVELNILHFKIFRNASPNIIETFLNTVRKNLRIFLLLKFKYGIYSIIDDVIQDTFLHVYNRIDNLYEGSFYGYLYEIAYRKALHIIKNPIFKSVEISKSSNDTEKDCFESIPNRDNHEHANVHLSPEEIVRAEEKREIILKFISNLCSKRKISELQKNIWIKNLEGLNNSQIAACLNVSSDYVKAQKSAALRIFREAGRIDNDLQEIY